MIKSYALETHSGPSLSINEDQVEVDLIHGLFMLFDAYGGAGVGDTIVKELVVNVKNFYSRVTADPDATMPFVFNPKFLLEGNSLVNAMHHTHNWLCKHNSNLEMAKRAGASSIVACKSENILTLVSTGNCKAYLFRNSKLYPIFVEDNFRYVSDDNFQFNFRMAPLSGLGLFPDLYLEVREIRVLPGDLYFLCTDGIYPYLEEEEIKYILTKPENLNKKIKDFLDLANTKGNWDNQSAILLQY